MEMRKLLNESRGFSSRCDELELKIKRDGDQIAKKAAMEIGVLERTMSDGDLRKRKMHDVQEAAIAEITNMAAPLKKEAFQMAARSQAIRASLLAIHSTLVSTDDAWFARNGIGYLVECPYCTQKVRFRATVCPHCTRQIDRMETP